MIRQYVFTMLLVIMDVIPGAQTGREDLSHPVHGDNCDIQKDGSCIRNPSGYVHRDFR